MCNALRYCLLSSLVFLLLLFPVRAYFLYSVISSISSGKTSTTCGTGPHTERITGRAIRPLNSPKMQIRKKILKKERQT